jgi:hypothetical protein
MTRRSLLSLALSVATVLCFAPAQGAEDGVADLEETLKFGLKCRRPVEFAFVELVVQKVNQGALPRELVLSTFEYARKRRSDIPFPYFQAALRKQAGAIGVEL